MYTVCLTMYVCKVLTECNLMFCNILLTNTHNFPNLHQLIIVSNKNAVYFIFDRNWFFLKQHLFGVGF